MCCIIRATNTKGKVKEYVYQKAHAAENRIKQLIAEEAEFTICTDDELRHISPVKSNEPDQS